MRKQALNLDGLNGLVYLMFLGHETYARKWMYSLVGTFVKNEANIYQAITRLEKRGYLIKKSTETHRRGNPGVRTAIFTPVFSSLNLQNGEYEKNRLINIIRDYSDATSLYPEILYLSQKEKKRIPWKDLLASYFYFLFEMMWTTFYGDLFLNQQIQSISLASYQSQIENLDKIKTLFKKAYYDNIYEKKNKLLQIYSIEDSYLLLVIYYHLMLGPAAPIVINFIAGKVGEARIRMENKVLITIARNQDITSDVIMGKINQTKKSKPSAAIIEIINRLAKQSFIEYKNDVGTPNHRIYNITESGLYRVLTLNEFWEDDSNLSDVVRIHYEKLPLLLGKKDFFDDIGWTNFYMQALRNFIPLELKMIELIKPIPYSPNYSENEIINLTNQSLEELPEDLKTEIENYPELDETLSQIIRCPNHRITTRVLGLTDIINTKKIQLPNTIKQLKNLQHDDDIKNYIDNYLHFLHEDYNLKEERLQWWIKILKRK